MMLSPNTKTKMTVLIGAIFGLLTLTVDAWSAENLSRRQVFQTASAAAAMGAVMVALPELAGASASTDAVMEELAASRTKIQEIPDLLQAQEWEKVRAILKTPPVNKLWNLGDSQNSVLKLAKETGDVELFEVKEELAYNLQMTDQLAYDNVFVYFQPGSGKIQIKEPTDSAKKAIEYLNQVISSQ